MATMKINKDQMKALRSSAGNNWRVDIANYLAEHQGCTEHDLFTATRGVYEDESKMKKNLASQYTYLRDEGYLISKEGDSIYLMTRPVAGKKDEFEVLPGMEDKVKKMLGTQAPAEPKK